MRTRDRSVLFVAMVVVSVVAMSASFSAAAVAQSDSGFGVEVSNETVATNETTTITVSADQAEHLRVVGDTAGWTVADVSPRADVLGNPTTDQAFPYRSDNESWFYAESAQDQLTITLTATVPEGEYEFTAQELDLQDNVVTEQTFTVQVGDSGADSVDRSGETRFSATNTGGQMVIGGNRTNEIPLEEGQFQIEGVIDEPAGTWESTNVEIEDLEVSGFQLSASAPNGFEGEFDRDTGMVSIEGELVVSTFGDDLTLNVAGSTSGPGQSNLEDRSVELVDDTFIVEQTGSETLDRGLGLPADEPGENRLELPLDLEFEDASVPPPEVDIEPLAFEGVPVGESETKTTTVTNTGDRPLDVAEISIDDDSLAVAEAPDTIEPGESVSVSVIYAPSTPGTVEATLNVSAAGGVSAGNATVEGEAVEPSTPEETVGASGPGFGLVPALLAIVVVALFGRRLAF